MRTFREVIHQTLDVYKHFEYSVPRERVLLEVLEILYTNRELDPEYIAVARSGLEYAIVKGSKIKEITVDGGTMK